MQRWSGPLLLVPLALGLLAHHGILRYTLLGYDTYPLILASRVQSWADFKGTFTEVMMDRRYPAGDFHRPSQNLILAAEYTLWGLHPPGYMVDNLLFFLGGVGLLFAVSRRVLGPAAWVGPLIASVYFALHPAILFNLPVVARRVESLAILLLLAALWVLPLGDARGRTWRCILAGLFVTLAIGGKEIGALGVVFVFVHQWLFGEKTGVASSLRRAAFATLPAVLGVAIAVAGRVLVIGSLGGHPGGEPGNLLSNLRQFASLYVDGAICPWTWFGDAKLFAWVALFLIVACCAAACFSARQTGNGPSPRFASLIFLGSTWAVCSVAFNGLAGTFNPRYLMFTLVGVAFVLAGLIEWIAWSLRAETRVAGRWRMTPVACAVAPLLVVILGLQSSPLFIDYWEWPEASRQQVRFLDALRQRLASARPGQTVEAPRLPHMPAQPSCDRPGIPVADMLADYTVQAWCELTIPDKRIKVVRGNVKPPRPGPDEIVLILRYERMPVERPVSGD